MRREDLAVHVRRDAVFEDSFRELHRRSAEEWKNRFYIVFEGKTRKKLCELATGDIAPAWHLMGSWVRICTKWETVVQVEK